MHETLALVKTLVARRDIIVSLHAVQKLAADNILLEELAGGIDGAVMIEDYPAAFKGPSILVLQQDSQGRPVHVLWGLEKGRLSPAVLVTAYRPDVARWSPDFLRRRTS